MERPNPADDAASIPEAESGTEPGRNPKDPKPQNPKVTPMDDGKKIKGGIDIKET